MIGMNIPSIYGGILGKQYWESRHDDKFHEKLWDRKLLKGCSRIDVKGLDDFSLMTESSSNEEDEKII